MKPAPRFTPEALKFLRALKRHNDREWFKARKERYEVLLRAPMLALVERLADEFKHFAPELVANPKISLYRIYRDTRFSKDKTPLKTHIAAAFPHRALAKHQGGGLYVEIAHGWVWVGGGVYAPEPEQLQALREHIAKNVQRLRVIVESSGFRRAVGTLEGERLRRVPRGFPADHEAAEFLKYRQFIAGREFPASFATSPRFFRGILDVFQQITPLVRFLNEPLLHDSRTAGRGPYPFSGAS